MSIAENAAAAEAGFHPRTGFASPLPALPYSDVGGKNPKFTAFDGQIYLEEAGNILIWQHKPNHRRL
jgi:hypothetical protein